MCVICKKFKKGTVDIDEAREMLEEASEYLTEEHIEEIEEMLYVAEDTMEYMNQRRLEQLEEDGISYDEEESYEEELPDYSDEYDIEEDD